MANTYVLINSSTVGSGGAAYITFSSIPATYTDLKLVISGRELGGDYVRFALDINATGTGLGSAKYLSGNGATASSSTLTAPDIGFGLNRASSTASVFSNTEIYFPNYTLSRYKTITCDGVEENNATAAISSLAVNLWSNTAAITSIKIVPVLNLAQYSTAYLYGIKNS